jgi:hypothetical protein
MRWRRTGSGAGLFRWRTHANEGGERSRADETGPGRGCATALSSALGARMYLEPELQAVLCLHIAGSPDRAVLPALRISLVLVAVAH